MKVFVAVVLGLLSALLISFEVTFLITNPAKPAENSPAFTLAVMVIAWAASAWLIQRNARSVAKVFVRGSLLGAAEWLMFIPIGLIHAGRITAEVAEKSSSGAGTAGAVVGGGIISAVGSGIAVGGALVCLLVFAVAHFMGREMNTSADTKKCPACAEMVKPDALKCRFCGNVFQEPATGQSSSAASV